MKTVMIETIKKIYSCTSTKAAVFDQNVNIMWSNDNGLFAHTENTSFYTPDIHSIGVIGTVGIKGIKSEEQMLMRTEQSVVPVKVVPLFEQNLPIGFIVESVDVLTAISKLNSSYSAIGLNKYISLVREISSAVAFSSELLKNELERAEQYDLANNANSLSESSYKAMSSIANLEELINYSSNDFNIQTASLSEFVENTIHAIIPKVSQNSIKIRYDIEEDITAKLDFERLLRVILNLVSNAIIYNISEEKDIYIKLSNIGESAALSVTDNGVGIDSDTAKLLFVPFSSSDMTKYNEGLGLTIVKLFCDRFSSSLTYTTKKNEGTTFTLRIPTCKPTTNLKAPISGYLFERYSPVDLYLYKTKL